MQTTQRYTQQLYSHMRNDPVCKAQQSRYGRCNEPTTPYGETEYLLKCAPHADLDIKFHTGGHFDTRYSLPCKRYVVERCARDWAPICDAFAHNKEPTRFPMADATPLRPCDAPPLNTGQQFLRQVLSERYCDFVGYKGYPRILDPVDPDSPVYHIKVPVQRDARIVMHKVQKDDPMYNIAKEIGGSDDFLA